MPKKDRREKAMQTEEKRLTGYPSIDKPWLKYYSEEAINAPLPECNIYEYMYENNKDFPRDIALNYLGRKISFGKMFEYIDKTAAAFLAIGVKPNDIVTVALPSIPEALYCVYALNKIGAVANMIHPLAGKQEIINYLNEVESSVAVVFDGTYKILGDDICKTRVEYAVVVSAGDSLPPMVKQCYMLKNPLHISGKTYRTWKKFLSEGKGHPVDIVKKDCHEMAIISHTGGTTGEPKGCMISNYSLNALMHQILCNFRYGRQKKSLVVLPPFINYSLVESMMAMLTAGFVAVLIPEYVPDKIGDYIKIYSPNIICSIPPYWEKLLESPNSTNMACLEYLYYGGEGMDSKLEEAINQKLKECGSRSKLCKGLGSTEIVAAATQTYPDYDMGRSVGVPLVKVNCKIIDQRSGAELKCMREGEICFSGPTLMLGYYNNSIATENIIKVHSDGRRWLHTGDIGYIDENGMVYVTGRIKRIVVTKGEDGQPTKMFPDRIEKAIYQNTAVELCCVIGIPDENRINYPKAVVVLKNNENQSEDVTNSIIETCKKELPDYMIPTEIEYRSDLPRTDRGKIDYRKLEDMVDKR